MNITHKLNEPFVVSGYKYSNVATALADRWIQQKADYWDERASIIFQEQ